MESRTRLRPYEIEKQLGAGGMREMSIDKALPRAGNAASAPELRLIAPQ